MVITLVIFVLMCETSELDNTLFLVRLHTVPNEVITTA